MKVLRLFRAPDQIWPSESSTRVTWGGVSSGVEMTGSRTAVLVCQGRAVAHGRLAPGRFDDPIAAVLLRDDELAVVEAVRSGAPPRGWGLRMEFEQVRAVAEGMAARTVAIDDALRARATP